MCLYVRSLTEKEGEKVHYHLTRGRDRIAIRRAQVIALSAQGMRVGEISRSVHLSAEYVRMLIRRFNREGAKLFESAKRPGQPVHFTEEIRAEIVEYALSPPRLLGLPFSHWSLEKLKDYLELTKVVKRISIETIRTILREEGVSLQRTKTWKESNDPAFERKKNA